jgi:hypothetical protein
LGIINKSFRLEPFRHLEIRRMTYASSSRKCSVFSDWSHNMNARDYLRFWLAKCKQTLQLWSHYENSDQTCRNCVWKFFYRNNRTKSMAVIWFFLGVWGVTPLSTTFHLCLGSLFYWWRKLEYTEKTTGLSQVTDKLYQIMLCRVHLAMKGVRTYNFSGYTHWMHR